MDLRLKNELKSKPAIVIRFKLPSLDYFEFDIQGMDYLLMKDLKYKIYHSGIGFHPSRMKMLYKKRLLNDMEALFDLHFQHHDEVEIILKIIDMPPLFFKYEEFVESISPAHLSINVSIDATIKIVFKKNILGQLIYIPSLLNAGLLKTLYHGDMQGHYKADMSAAIRRQFRKWTDFIPEQNILLLRVDDALDLRLDSIKYDVEGVNDGYIHGDRYSWQRYTSFQPIDCAVSADSFTDEAPPHTVQLKPYAPLAHNCHYAIWLSNNIPTVPWTFPPADFDFLSEGMGEDMLCIFRTMKR